jgi:hypothetical protein
VDDGARTRDSQNHNLELYQLSYIHRNTSQNTIIWVLSEGPALSNAG